MVALGSTLALFTGVRGIVQKMGRSYGLERAARESATIGDLLDREAQIAVSLSQTPDLRAWMRDEKDSGLRGRAMQTLDAFRRAFLDHNFFVATAATDTYYNQPSTGPLADTTLDAKNPSDAWFFASLEGGSDVAFNLDFDRLIGQTEVWINCLVRNDGKIIGVTGTGLDITEVIAHLITDEANGVASLLIDDSGAITAHPEEKYMVQNGMSGANGAKITVFDLASSERDRATLRTLVSEAKSGKAAAAVVAMQGRPRLTVVRAIPNINWMTVVSVDTRSVISTSDFLPLYAVLVASILLVLLVLGFLMDGLVLRPLAQMTESARRISAGDYRVEVPSRRNDEIGILAGALEGMAGKVRRYTEDLEALVTTRTAELRTANVRLEENNRQIMESIRYARIIQEGVLPAAEVRRAQFAEHQLFHRQRDTVGGDFLYVRELAESAAGRAFVVAVVDCEGHGVPGALVTMMATSFLHLITSGTNSRDPAMIIEELDDALRSSTTISGMEIALCACFPQEQRLVFSGAGMPLYVLDPAGNVSAISGRKKPVAFRHEKLPGARAKARNVELPATGSTFFMVTDGFVDQAGGDLGRAYGTKRLLSMFTACREKRLDDDTPGWEREFDSYRGRRPQRDDVLALAFRI